MMPMTTPSGLPTKALQFWGSARGAVASRGSTADVWAAINNHAASLGLDSPGLSLRDFNQLRSAAAGVRNAGEALRSANPISELQANMIGRAPYARAQVDQNAAPMWLAGFNHITANEFGDETSGYRTVRFTGTLPGTYAELLRQVNQDAEALADKYNQSHVDIEDLEILAI